MIDRACQSLPGISSTGKQHWDTLSPTHTTLYHKLTKTMCWISYCLAEVTRDQVGDLAKSSFLRHASCVEMRA